MKAIWTGAIGFGLVNIPVKLYTATEESSLDLDMLDKKDLSNIRFKRVNEHTGKEVAWENIVKGYNYDGKYIVLNEEDFEKASPEKSQLLSIDQFVKMEEIDSIYFETPYYIEPQKGGEAAYNLLREALKKTGMAGLGTFVMRGREVLGILRPFNELLLFQRMRYSQEIRNTDELKIPKGSVKPAELKMAVALIAQLEQPFDISAYKDDYTAALMKIIQSKAKGKKTAAPSKMHVAYSKTRDLMEQLKASLSASKGKKIS
ncbi:Ku protein [Niabella ginsenosidivorans]|uniref:Non-homologous end joining protein Ku n=1 Tax=Niabella ginsenosidivorans TaxID=1176587 RepID=A0A1A9I4J8_9BACT|nr:Ku protein [Niabella ginsenosidivorans]ANH81612.1 Ku protein [Niabella ginsenosidivorans]